MRWLGDRVSVHSRVRLSKAIRSARVVAFDDLGMEAIHEFEFADFPVTVAVDSRGRTIHQLAEVKVG